MPLEWKEIYTLHHKKIDAQHQELFRITNTLEALDAHRTSKAQLAVIWLIRYILELKYGEKSIPFFWMNMRKYKIFRKVNEKRL